MDIMSVMQNNIASLRSAIDMTLIRKSMHQDTQVVYDLLQGMLETQRISMENAVTPHLGGRIDITL